MLSSILDIILPSTTSHNIFGDPSPAIFHRCYSIGDPSPRTKNVYTLLLVRWGNETYLHKKNSEHRLNKSTVRCFGIMVRLIMRYRLGESNTAHKQFYLVLFLKHVVEPHLSTYYAKLFLQYNSHRSLDDFV